MNTTQIIVDAVINAPQQKVWDYYTNPIHIIKWNFASDDWCCPSAENDMRVGGTYKARMEAKDGSFGFDFEAIYEKINTGKSFTYAFDGRKATLTFLDLDTQTNVSIAFDPENENPIEMQRGGWQAILNSFKHYTENN